MITTNTKWIGGMLTEVGIISFTDPPTYLVDGEPVSPQQFIGEWMRLAETRRKLRLKFLNSPWYTRVWLAWRKPEEILEAVMSRENRARGVALSLHQFLCERENKPNPSN